MRVVVFVGKGNNLNKLNTVESYDVVGDKWSFIPNIINSSDSHDLVVVMNNVIGHGTDTYEDFNDSSKTCAVIKFP